MPLNHDPIHARIVGTVVQGKIRLVEFVVGTLAHFCRVFALAPVFAFVLITLGSAAALTKADIPIGFLEFLVPEELKGQRSGSYSGDLNTVMFQIGLPFAKQYAPVLLGLPFIVGLIEQIANVRLRRHRFGFRRWALAALSYYVVLVVYTSLFAQLSNDPGFLVRLLITGVLFGILAVPVAGGALLFAAVGIVEEHAVNSVVRRLGLSEFAAPHAEG